MLLKRHNKFTKTRPLIIFFLCNKYLKREEDLNLGVNTKQVLHNRKIR